MNSTNRVINRVILVAVGLILLVLGGGILLVFSVPAAADMWHDASAAGTAQLRSAIHATRITGSTLSWVTVGTLAAALLLIVLLVVTIARVGGGRTNTLIRTRGRDSDSGRITLESGFVSEALTERFEQRDEILASRISAATIQNASMMHVRITPRQNTSPRQVADDVDRLLENLAVLTDTEIPTCLSIRSGLRSRLARDQRTVA